MARKISRSNHIKPNDQIERLDVIQKSSSGIHFVMRQTLLCSKLMGLLPLAGLCSSKVDNVRFCWKTPYILIVASSILGQITMSGLCLYRLFNHGLSINSFSNTLFYTCNMLNTWLLLRFSYLWPCIMKEIVLIENKLPPMPKKVTYYCNTVMIIVLLTALGTQLAGDKHYMAVMMTMYLYILVEHLLALTYGIKIARVCGEGMATETFFMQNLPWVFEVTPFALWKGILAQFSNVQSTMMWSYCDLLIMVFSIYLTEHFVTHMKFLKACLRMNNVDWNDFRIQYLDIVNLVKIIDVRIGYFIVLSFTANMYWICIQLFNNLNQTTSSDDTCAGKLANNTDDDLQHTIYFAYSFSFLVGRTLGVALLAARIHTNSIKPLSVLYEVPTWEYTVEVRRFINQISNIKVALSGLEFFYVTRGMLLTLIGTIVTYELVLVQFNSTPSVTILFKHNTTG